MTLGRKILMKNAALLVGLVLLGCVTTWGLLGLRQSVRTVLGAYQQLGRIETAETYVTAAKSSLIRGEFTGPAFSAPLHQAESRLNAFFSVTGYDYASGDAANAIQGVHESYTGLAGLLQTAEPTPGMPVQTQSISDIAAQTDNVAAALHRAATSCDQFIQQQKANTEERFRTTLISVTTLSGIILLTAVLLSVSQYRSVVLPLRHLREAVSRVAKGHFQERVNINADLEFQQLVDEFNGMAEKLDDFYERLEEKVAQKSRELVRSERLASVGFLAAGVAHEINNPLNIISGYAELSLKKLNRGSALARNQPRRFRSSATKRSAAKRLLRSSCRWRAAEPMPRSLFHCRRWHRILRAWWGGSADIAIGSWCWISKIAGR